MAKKNTKETTENLGTLSSPKTNQDFNKKKPSPADPNELKSKTNPEKNKAADEIKKPLKIKSKVTKARTRRVK